METPQFAKIFTTGRSQAVRLPKEFRFEGDCVRIRRVAHGVLLEPIATSPEHLFELIDGIGGELLPENIHQQPPAPVEELFP